MSRGLLDDSDLEKISREIPDLSKLEDTVLSLSPDFLSISFPRDSNVPIASVCFHDALNALQEARYALFEVLAHRIWYLEKKDPPDKMCAAFFSRYYADDAALRLYSAGEHLANGIILMLEISDEEMKPYRIKGKQGKEKSSQQIVVGNYLCGEMRGHLITKEIIKLRDSEDWKKTIIYRNKWVHEQPPTVTGMGIVYKRGKRWKPLPNGEYTLGIGGGDKPEYSVEDLLGFIKPAIFQLTYTFTSVVEFYMDLLKND